MRLFNRAALLVGLAMLSGTALKADNGCGCTTGNYGVTCCNPQEKTDAYCTVYIYDEDGNIVLKVRVKEDVEVC